MFLLQDDEDKSWGRRFFEEVKKGIFIECSSSTKYDARWFLNHSMEEYYKEVKEEKRK